MTRILLAAMHVDLPKVKKRKMQNLKWCIRTRRTICRGQNLLHARYKWQPRFGILVVRYEQGVLRDVGKLPLQVRKLEIIIALELVWNGRVVLGEVHRFAAIVQIECVIAQVKTACVSRLKKLTVNQRIGELPAAPCSLCRRLQDHQVPVPFALFLLQ